MIAKNGNDMHLSTVVHYKLHYKYIKWMPLYWGFIYLFNLLIYFPSFLLQINAFPMWYEIWKGIIFFFFWQTVDSNLGQSHKKTLRYML